MNDLDRAEIYALIRNIYRCQCQATHNANVAIAHATWVLIPLNTTNYDHVPHKQSPMHDNAVNNSRIYARIAGVYGITAQFSYAPNATGLRNISVCYNSAGAMINMINGASYPTHPSADSSISTAATCYLNAGDYIEMFARQTSGAALNVLAYSYSPILSLSYLGE